MGKKIESHYDCQVSMYGMKSQISDLEISDMYSQLESDTLLDGWRFTGGYRRWEGSYGYNIFIPLQDASGNFIYGEDEIKKLIQFFKERFESHFKRNTVIHVDVQFNIVQRIGSWQE